MHEMSVGSFVPMLTSLSAVLDKGAEHARAKKIDPATLIGARLAPDMYTLDKQIELACDNATNGLALILGKEPPRFGGSAAGFDALKARVAKANAWFESLKARDFEGTEDRAISMPLMDKLVLEADGLSYLRDWVLPHFYFHVVTAYDILRHKGVEIGKRDYMGGVGRYIKQKR